MATVFFYAYTDGTVAIAVSVDGVIVIVVATIIIIIIVNEVRAFTVRGCRFNFFFIIIIIFFRLW